MKFLAGYKGALMVVSHDIALLDASITRILHLDRDGVVEYRGTYTQYRTARARDEERLTALAQRQEREIRRLKTLADSMRGQTAKRARKAKTLDTRAAKLRERKVEGPSKERKVTYRFPEPPHCGKTVLTAKGTREVLRGTRRAQGRDLHGGQWGASPHHGIERGRQDQPPESSPTRPRPTRAPSRSATGSSRGTTPRSTRDREGRRRARATCKT